MDFSLQKGMSTLPEEGRVRAISKKTALIFRH